MALRMSPICGFVVVFGEEFGVGVLLLLGSYIVTLQRCFQIAHCDAARFMSVICCVIVLQSLIPKSFSLFVIGLLRNFEAISIGLVQIPFFR